MDENTQRKVQLARQKGWSEDEIARFAYADMVKKQAQTTQAPPVQQVQSVPVEKPKEKGFKASDLLPIAGGVVGAVGGSILGPVGTAIGGGGGAALGETIRQKIEGEKTDIGKIGTEAALSAIPVGKVFGTVGKIAGKVVGGTAGKAAENLALRTLKPSKTQIAKFAQKTGTKLEDFIVKNKLFEKGTQQVDDIIAPLQAQYDELALSQATRVKPQQVYAGFTSKIKELKDIPTTQAKSLAGQLSEELKLVKSAWKGKTDIGMDELTNLRRQVDQLIPEGKFMADPLMQGKNRYVRTIYKEVIDQATGGKTAPVGKELSKLYAYRELADLQQQLGRGTLPIGMQQLIGAVTGAALGGGGTLATGGSPESALKNSLIGIGFVHLANNPKVLALAAKTLNKISKAGTIGATPGVSTLPVKIAGQIVGQGGARTIAAPFRGGEPTGELPASPTDISFVKPAVASEIAPVPPVSTTQEMSGGYTKEQLIKAADWDIANNEGKGLNEIKMLYDLHFGGEIKPKTKPATIKNMENLATAGLKGLADAQTMFEEDPNIVLKGLVTGGLANRKFEAAISRAIEGILRARSGAAVPETEVKKYRATYGPRIGDSKATALYKLEALRQDLQGILTGNENVVPDNQLPASPAQVTFPQAQ